MKTLFSPFHIRLPFTVPLVVRYLLITLLLTAFVLGCWSGITPVAHAATRAATAPRHARQSTGVQQQPAVASQPGTPRHPALRPDTSSSVNQLGLLPFYTYISLRLTDHLSLHVNVASGNLVIESDDLAIQGTGLNLSVQSVYNSLASDSLTLPSSLDNGTLMISEGKGTKKYIRSGGSHDRITGRGV